MKTANSDGAKPPSAKKLKQATLPFFSMNNKQSSESKKRKKSESDSDDIKVLKVLCHEKNNASNDAVKDSVMLKEEKGKSESKENEEVEVMVIKDDEKEDKKVEKEAKVEIKDEEKAGSSSESPTKSGSEVEDEVASSPLASEPEESEMSSANVSLNVSSLIDTDDKDSLVSFSDIPLTPMKNQSASAKKPRKLTPKQIQRQQENLKRREEKEKEKEREREEREKKKQEEKENRKRQREEKEEQRQKERLEKIQKKQAEIDQKNQEKKAREDERRKKEEEKEQEKRRKEEERLQDKKRKEEEKLKAEEDKKKAEEEAAKKKEKAAAAFASFFTLKRSETKETPPPQSEEIEKTENFMPFRVKSDMRLAPPTRRNLQQDEHKVLDESIVTQGKSKLYLKQLKDKNYKPKKGTRTWPVPDPNEDIVIIEPRSCENRVVMSTQKKEKMRAKYLQFAENRRPAYFGTWRKNSKCINPRQPLALDKTHFDYEVDSDDEWEEEEQGESLHGSDDEKESEDEYEVDNQMFVPHGYLSDDEEGLDEAVPPELKKETLKIKEIEFQAEMKKKLKPLKPEIIGPFWQYPEKYNDIEWDMMFNGLQQFKVIRWTTDIICFPPKNKEEFEEVSDNECNAELRKNSSNGGSVKRGPPQKTVPEEAIPDFIRLIHGNTKSRKFLAKEFVIYWEKLKNPEYKEEVQVAEEESEVGNNTNNNGGKLSRLISVANAIRTLKSIAKWIAFPEEGPIHQKLCWCVSQEVREKHNLLNLPLPNEWVYNLKDVKPRGRPKEEKVKEDANTSVSEESGGTNKSTPTSLITKFTKKLTEAERKQQIKRKSSVEVVATPPKIKIKSTTSSPFSPSSAFRISPSTSTTTPTGIKAYCTPKQRSDSASSTPGSEFKAPAPVDSRTPSSGGEKKEKKGRRVSILVSVPCGQEIPSQASASKQPQQQTDPSPVVRAFQFSKAAGNNTQDEDDCAVLD